MTALLNILNTELGADRLLTGDAIGPRYVTDWTGLGTVRPLAVILPGSTEQVSTVLRICHAHGQTVVPQGGMTGLSGGAIPAKNDVCLSLERMRGIDEIDHIASTMTVRAGTALQKVQDAATQAGFEFPLDMRTRASCQIGGVLATNAGGIRVIQAGTARDQVAGLEVVLADGSILSSMNKATKNNTGYDLKQLFIGSEGTLGVITRAVLRLRPKPAARYTALCALAGFPAATGLLGGLRNTFAGEIAAFELMWADFFHFGLSVSRTKSPPFQSRHAIYALIEQISFDPDDSGSRFADFLSRGIDEGTISDAAIPQSARETEALWEIRECTAEFPSHLDPINFDISLPAAEMGRFAEECKAMLSARWPNHRSFFFGHIGDSNLHVTVDGHSVPGATREAVDEMIYALVGGYGGAISAEHGIGLLKRKYLNYSRSRAELRAMWAIKNALDPKGILNPGKVLPDDVL